MLADELDRARDRARMMVGKIVREREYQRDERLVVRGIRAQHVFADTLALRRLVQQPVAFGLGERGGMAAADSGFNSNIATSGFWLSLR
jgi:hypothetical protein